MDLPIGPLSRHGGCVTTTPQFGRAELRTVAAGTAAMALVGSSVGISRALVAAPLLTAQAIRYSVASAVLLILARACGVRITRPRGREWLWLASISATGLVLFNIAIVRGVAHTGPAMIAVAVACVPVMMIVLGAVSQGPEAAARLTASDLAAVAYLTVLVTVVAFVLWYSTVAALGPARAGVLTGIAPVSAALTGMATGSRAPSALMWAGIVIVMVGLTAGLWSRTRLGPPRTAARAAAPSATEGPAAPSASEGSIMASSEAPRRRVRPDQ
jgi:drug/metabolite transporter (DMT)-like permease